MDGRLSQLHKMLYPPTLTNPHHAPRPLTHTCANKPCFDIWSNIIKGLIWSTEAPGRRFFSSGRPGQLETGGSVGVGGIRREWGVGLVSPEPLGLTFTAQQTAELDAGEHSIYARMTETLPAHSRLQSHIWPFQKTGVNFKFVVVAAASASTPKNRRQYRNFKLLRSLSSQ